MRRVTPADYPAIVALRSTGLRWAVIGRKLGLDPRRFSEHLSEILVQHPQCEADFKIHYRTLKDTLEHNSWRAMRARCNDPKSINYRHYGGRGIKVCERWASYALFIADMGPKPTKQHTLERLDSNRPYEPANCIWANWDTQAKNRRGVRFIEFAGQRKTLTDWARSLGITPGTLHVRLKNWPLDRALTLTSTQ